MQILRFFSVPVKFSEFPISFFKVQVTSFSNFSSFFSVITDNSSAVFWLKHNILSTKVAKQTANFQTCHCSHWNSPNSFLMSFLEPRVSFSSKFASLFSIMRHNSSVVFNLKLYIMLWTKWTYDSANFQTFNCSHEN